MDPQCAEGAPLAEGFQADGEHRKERSWMRINRAINALGQIPIASEVPRGFMLHVCEASEEDWDAFVASENQALRSTHTQLIDGRIFIVEFPGRAHDVCSRALDKYIGNIPHTEEILASREGTYLESGPRYEADESYGPIRGLAETRGVTLPTGIAHWGDYMTLKVEVGVSRGWGTTPGSLDWKATRAWRQVPGVAFVLCIAVDEDLQHASYKKYELPDDQRGVVPAIAEPTDIVAGMAPVEFDARRLLGLTADMELPHNFPDPLTVDLFAVLEDARNRI